MKRSERSLKKSYFFWNILRNQTKKKNQTTTKFKPHACARYLFSNMYQIVPKNKYKTDHRGWMNFKVRAHFNRQIWENMCFNNKNTYKWVFLDSEKIDFWIFWEKNLFFFINKFHFPKTCGDFIIYSRALVAPRKVSWNSKFI